MEHYVILHGHFYQPPRENPWTGLLERQDSASPYKDWNRRIASECYAANGASRVLDAAGRIKAMMNNYETLSFNFGPTLLSWLEKAHPDAYARILEADRNSITERGHGNAVAQAFNHTILPLDRPRDALTQIRWGLEDFRRRFAREADGMWLPECAVNKEVLDLLIDEGMRFVVLSPLQAEAFRTPGGEWQTLHETPAPSNRPLFIQRPGGRIAAFFYHSGLASRLSFGHLLRSREDFEAALRDGLRETGGPMISVATDGEIYGHHEPFGDMCLAALTYSLPPEGDLIFTNYAAYLRMAPPLEEVRLKDGNEGLGSSWSCFHGVDRWKRDCGCHTGGREGWNQKWRVPLRQAFDALRDAAEESWGRRLRKLADRDPHAILDLYGRVLSRFQTSSEFAVEILGSRASEDEVRELLVLMEGARYLHYMYTSCGWFFAELSGLEPVQNMRYALRAAVLLDVPQTVLLKELQRAKSNLPAEGNGADLLHGKAWPEIHPGAHAAALFFWRRLHDLPGDDWGDWRCLEFNGKTVKTGGERRQEEGLIRLREISLLRDLSLSYRARVEKGPFASTVTIKVRDETVTVPLYAMPAELREGIQDSLLRSLELDKRRLLGGLFREQLVISRITESLNLTLSPPERRSLETSLHDACLLFLDELENSPIEGWKTILDDLETVLEQRAVLDLEDAGGVLGKRLADLVSKQMKHLEKHWDGKRVKVLVTLLRMTQNRGFRPVRPDVQNFVYSLLTLNAQRKDGLEELAAHVNIADSVIFGRA